MTGHWCFVSVEILDVGMDCIRHYVIFYFKIFLLPNCQRVYFIWSLGEAKRRLIKKETFRLHTHKKKNLKCFITSHRPSNYIYNFWITKTTFRILTSTKFPAVLTQKQFQYKNSLLLLLLFAIWNTDEEVTFPCIVFMLRGHYVSTYSIPYMRELGVF